MAKAMLIIDVPTKCAECQLFYNTAGTKMCEAIGRLVECENKRPEWCPLREVPKKKIKSKADSTSLIRIGEIKGYNACIDEILGGGE